jgi:hypothetical protein
MDKQANAVRLKDPFHLKTDYTVLPWAFELTSATATAENWL